MHVAYLRVADDQYPRNRRIRNYFESRGDRVDVRPRAARSTLSRKVEEARYLLRVRHRDAYILGEFALGFAPIARLLATMNHAPLVVDAFVGRYETEVEDWGRTAPGTREARRLERLDRRAYRLADLVIIDTEVRAAQLRSRNPGVEVMALPVGAPAWAHPGEPGCSAADGILYYGNYIPLHGVDSVVRGFARAVDHGSRFRLTLVGNGSLRASIEQLACELGVQDRCTFIDAVPEDRLHDLIRDHRIVMGVFGDSTKARSVIANKVWQGLASGATVVTRRSPALRELAQTVGAALVEVDADTESGLVDAIARALQDVGSEPREADVQVAEALESLVDERFSAFHDRLELLVR